MARNYSARSEAYDAQNLECALIIVAEPERYDGLPLIWARLVLQRLGYLIPENEKAA
jgi:hypothetical protein